MESITLTINPPITEYCRKCDYEASYSFGSFRCKCPECGEESMGHNARPKEKRAISVIHYEGSFNFADPSEKQWQYIFNFVPNGKKYSFVVDDELDIDDPIELAIELKDIFDKYIYTSSKEKINELVELLNNDEMREDQDNLRVTEEKENLERKLYELNHYHKFYE